jgi:hypothetical protein
MKTPSHKWAFRPRFRTNAFGWRGSKLAIERLREAVGEIKAVARTAPETAAEGAVLLMERLWSALQGVDSSSGALGNATNKTVHELNAGDVWQAMGYALRAAEALDRVEATRGLIRALAQDPNTNAFVREQLVHGTPYVLGR